MYRYPKDPLRKSMPCVEVFRRRKFEDAGFSTAIPILMRQRLPFAILTMDNGIPTYLNRPGLFSIASARTNLSTRGSVALARLVGGSLFFFATLKS